MESSRQHKRGSIAPQTPKAKRILRGCLWSLAAIFLLLLGGWLYLSNNADRLLKDRILKIADQTLNGELDFASIKLDLLGRAIFRDVSITATGEEQPVIRSDRVRVSLDLINLIGPNRGQSAFVVVLEEPEVRMVRLLDGSTNLERLVKEPDPSKPQEPFGLSLLVSNGVLDFEDRCLVSSDYPRIEAEDGLLSELLRELDYDILAAAETEPHRERIKLHGNVVLNSRREELSFNVNAVRVDPGGRLIISGKAGTDNGMLDMRLQGSDISAASFTAYGHALFPRLRILTAAEQSAATEGPSAAALLRRLDLRMKRASEEEEFVLRLTADLEDTSLNTASLPFLRLDNGNFEFDEAADSLNVNRLQLAALGSTVSGSVQFGPESGTLGGRLRIDITDIARLAAEADYTGPPLAGNVQLDLRPGGSLDDPQIGVGFSNGDVSFDGHRLGRPGGRIELDGDELALDSLRFSGGELPLTLSGKYNIETEGGELEYKLSKGDIPTLLSFAGEELPAELQDAGASGSLSADGSVTLSAGELQSLDADLNGSNITVHGVKLGTVRGGLSMAGDRLSFRELKLTGGQLPLTLDGSLDPQLGNAELQFSLGKSGLAELLALAGDSLPGDVSELEPQGSVSAEGSLSMSAKKLSSASGTLNGTELVISGVKLGTVSAKLATSEGRLRVESASFSGGEVPLSLSGSTDMAFENGSFSIEAGPLAVDKAARLASRFSEQEIDTQGLSGSISASGRLGFDKGQPQSSLTISSEALMKDGHRLEKLSVKGSLQGSSFELDAATATLVMAEAVDLGSFRSDEPLRIPLRVGGSVSSTGKDGAVSLIGSAQTANLIPSQAEISFKLVGPVKAPQLRLQLKTEHDNEALIVNAEAYLAGGMQPASAKLTWYDSQLFYEGSADIEGQSFEGKLSASQVSLDRFIDDEHISGEFSLDGQLSGSFSEPTLSGRLRSPRLSYRTDQRRYDVTSMDIGFKLKDGNAISVSNGSFDFDKQPFTVDGVLGSGGADLTVSCQKFNLLSALSMVPTSSSNSGGVTKSTSTPIRVESSGPLLIKFSGSLEKPSARVTYSSGQGQVEGNRFDSASLVATVTGEAAVLEKFEIISPQGRASATGGANFDPLHFNAQATITSFDVRLLTALAGDLPLGGLTGQLNGSLNASGGTESYSADGELRLVDGRFSDVDITEMTAAFRTHEKGIELTSARLRASGTTLTASGVIASKLNDSTVSAKAEQLDLSLLNPLLPADGVQLDGIVRLDARLIPSKGQYPDLELNLADTGAGITVDGNGIDSANATIRLKGDQATLSPLTLEKGGSTLEVTGKLDLRELSPESRRIPLDIMITANSFQIDDIASFLPDELAAQLPGGNVTCTLDVDGNSFSPILNGELAVNLLRMPPALPLDLAELRAQFNLKNNEFSIRSMDLVPRDTSYYSTRVTGSARLAFNPPRIADGSMSVVFSDGGNHSRISLRMPDARGEQQKVFEGTLGGSVQIRTSQNMYHPDDARTQMFVLSGNPVINGGSGGSLFRFSPGPQAEDKSQKIPLRFEDLTVMVLPGTSFTTGDSLMQMESSIHTEAPGLVINGIPNALLAQDQLTVKGNVIIDSGTLRAYTHTLRMDETKQNRLHFTGMTTSTGLYPFLTARATTTLKGALRGESQSAIGPSNNDLRVFFDFDNVQLDPNIDMMGNSEGLMDKVRLSSEPPRSPNQIKVYLLGGVGTLLSGDGDIDDVAREELFGIGGNFLSGQLEKGLDLDSVTIGGSGDLNNPFHVGAEKDINDRLRIGYFRDFYDSLGTSEEVSFRYKLFEEAMGSRYKGLNLQLNMKDDALQGSGSEIMLQYTFSF